MFKIKYFFNDTELIDNTKVKCEISHAYGESLEEGYVINVFNKLCFIYKNEWNNKEIKTEVNDCNIRIVEVL